MDYLVKLQRCRDPRKVALYIRALGTQWAAVTSGRPDSERLNLVAQAESRAFLCENAPNMREVKRMLRGWGYLFTKKERQHAQDPAE